MFVLVSPYKRYIVLPHLKVSLETYYLKKKKVSDIESTKIPRKLIYKHKYACNKIICSL